MIRSRHFVAVLLLVLVSGCVVKPFPLDNERTAALAAEGSAQAGQATIYVLRDGSGQIWNITLNADGASRGTLSRNSYLEFSVAPGQHILHAKYPPLTGLPEVAVEGAFDADKTYYFLVTNTFSSGYHTMEFGIGLNPVRAADAKKWLTEFERREPPPPPQPKRKR